MATTSKKVRYDAFIESVRPDPKSTDELVLLQGYIGKSDLDGHVRVYSDPTLSDFIEVPEAEIRHADPVKHEEDPLGGSRLWVRKTTVFTTGDPNLANRVKSSFLEGDLVRAFGNQGGRIPAAAAGGGNNNLPSAFLEQGCVPHTEPFGVCNVHTREFFNCQVYEPPTLQRSACFATCPHSPCTTLCPTRRHPFCIPCTQNTQVVGFPNRSVACPDPAFTIVRTTTVVNPGLQAEYNYAAYIGQFNPYNTGF